LLFIRYAHLPPPTFMCPRAHTHAQTTVVVEVSS